MGISKMLPLVTLLLLVAEVVVGQLETETNGLSGPLCGRRRNHCLTDAQCGIDGRMCECHTPLVGNGKLGCVPQEDATCWLQSDPHLKNLYKEWLSLATPCRFRLMQYQYVIQRDQANCQVEVYADNALYSEGMYYVERIEIRINLRHARSSTLGVLIEGSAENGVYKFKEWRRKNSQKEWRNPTQENDHIGNVKVPSSYDQNNNFAEITAERCGLYLKFRPADISVTHQTQVPGVMVKLDGSKIDEMSFNTDDLSSTPVGPSVREEAESRDIALSVWTLNLAFMNVEFIDSLDPTCDRITQGIQTECSNEGLRLDALDLCEGIFNDESFLKCLDRKGQIGTNFQVNAFGHCMMGDCMQNTTLCGQAKDAIQQLGCPMPDVLARHNCAIHGSNAQ